MNKKSPTDTFLINLVEFVLMGPPWLGWGWILMTVGLTLAVTGAFGSFSLVIPGLTLLGLGYLWRMMRRYEKYDWPEQKRKNDIEYANMAIDCPACGFNIRSLLDENIDEPLPPCPRCGESLEAIGRLR